ncbi:MAG: BlaI/MecI/CopY family transcriptional regulator [Lachnospiraceae bacterium]|jgi:predicted transcriptional regulator|nr:BlaI/MecI/CopY family transcriptional regulator [Lachnospiraceae bacterium]MDE6990915.1 BlaI/MecI/CopY family transcriptional regulator [Lachnospiraceae bacterium]MDE7001592.1 BlaI/MecI/CopY family transcriptional regulator [Lachnospiraceae bacterium]
MAQQISESELVLMKIIWKNGGTALYALIMEELAKEKNEWKNNTVLTLLSRLVEKKFLKVKKIGRRNEYVAVVTEAQYQAMQTHSFLDRVYEGNVKNLVSTLLRQDILSPDELREIEAFWRDGNE